MWKRECGSLPVVDDAGKVMGMVTDRDMLIALGTRNQRAADLTVAEVMTSPAVTCKPGDDLEEALSKMNTYQIRRLPVVDDGGALAGMITMNDIVLRADKKTPKEQGIAYETVMHTLKGICDHAPMTRNRTAAA